MPREIELRLSGSGGQGLILGARVLAAALAAEGLNVAHSQSYEPTSRGGLSRSDLVVSDGEVDYPLVTALDYLVIMDQVAAHASSGLLKPDAVVIVNSSRVTSPPQGAFTTCALPLTDIARKVGSGRVANIVALGVLTGVGGPARQEFVEQAVGAQAPAGFRELNLKAFREGLQLVCAP
jgi:2-oxoglutarate ferredoxin oxidoreductase subunit gamma